MYSSDRPIASPKIVGRNRGALVNLSAIPKAGHLAQLGSVALSSSSSVSAYTPSLRQQGEAAVADDNAFEVMLTGGFEQGDTFPIHL